MLHHFLNRFLQQIWLGDTHYARYRLKGTDVFFVIGKKAAGCPVYEVHFGNLMLGLVLASSLKFVYPRFDIITNWPTFSFCHHHPGIAVEDFLVFLNLPGCSFFVRFDIYNCDGDEPDSEPDEEFDFDDEFFAA